MGRLAGFRGRKVRRVAESLGWQLVRVRGDHFVYRKPGVPRNLSIPDQREVNEPLLSALVKEMGLSVDEFLKLARK
ncbi:MAG: type II toxin-antitoxin system HicA family toxin [Tepidiformaceae bacterium]